MTKQELIQVISSMNVAELAALTKELQNTFGVSPMSAYMQAPIQPQQEVVPVEEPTSFDVYIVSAGDRKIQVIKRVRELTALGLKEAKDLVDNLPGPVRTGTDKETAEKLKAAIESEGATVEVRPA